MASDANSPDLFTEPNGECGASAPRPLALRMRPRTLGEVIGQEHVLGEGCLLPRLIESDTFGSLLFYGPPGCGKTSLAEVIALQTKSKFVRINAVLSNVAELRDVLRMARYESEARTILFIDEIHRFNKSQQDLLLPDVEAGNIRLIGATTHNPGFYINPPLLSRSHLFKLEPVALDSMAEVLKLAATDGERGLGGQRCEVDSVVFQAIAEFSEGDLRRGLNALETLLMSQPLGSKVGLSEVEVFAKERQIRYDRDEDAHYDHASAFIKSVRGSDPDAALYWCFKMLKGGEDPRFLARRLVILASEDVGLANSHAMTVAVAAFEACEKVGLPECEFSLAHAVLYLATSPKSNSVTQAIAAVKKHLREEPVQPVPIWLRDGHNKTNRSFGNGKDYLYSHDFPQGISGQDYMTEPTKFYEPSNSGAEAATKQRLEQLKKLKASIQKARTQAED